MTEERKQELRQLLQEAMENLKIRNPFGQGNLSYSKVDYKNILNQRLTFYGIGIDVSHNLIYLQYQPDIENGKTKARLLEFIKKELNQFIEDDEIRYTSYNIDGCATDGFRLSKPLSSRLKLSDILEHLLKVALALGVDKAVLTFDEDSCPEGRHRYYQSITSLEGITIETEIQICRGIRLVPIPRDIAFQLNHNLRRNHHRQRDKGTTLLIIERLRLSVFHKPFETTFDEGRVVNLPFQVEANEIELSNQGMVMDFRETFCQALSLACNSMVMFDYFWDYFAADVFRSEHIGQKVYYSGPIGKSAEAGQSEIEEAIRLYKILEIFDQKARGKFEIALERWRESKTSQTYEDTVIDLAIALEALYLSDRDGNSELSFQFRLRASWFLGKGKAYRKRLMDKFKAIYNLRSQAVHSGKISEKIKIRKGEEPIATSEFIPKAQDLCRKSIIRILEDGEFPDWDDLILGEDPSSTN